MPKPVEIVCHKGANEYAPENTFAAAQLCIDWGMDYVEIDIRSSKDGVLYVIHGPEVDKTTNGTGSIADLMSAEIDRLDAGSWFHPQFAGQPVPRLDNFLRWIKGKIKIFFDVKLDDPRALIELVYQLGFERDCFFWCDTLLATTRFRQLDADLSLKVNINTAKQVQLVKEEFGANIVEVGLAAMTQELLDTCRACGMKVMINHLHKDPQAFREILRWGVDLANVDHGDIFAQVAKEFDDGTTTN